MILYSKILEQLELKHIQSAGHCGVYITQFEGNLTDLKEAINELYILGKITHHEGIHGKLIKIKK